MFGAPPEWIAAIEAHEEADRFEIWPENAETLGVFLALQTQWTVSFGGVIGLNYPSIMPVLEIYGIEDRRRVFEDLQAMEAAALKVLRRKGSGHGHQGSH